MFLKLKQFKRMVEYFEELGIDPDEQLLVSSFDGPIDRFVNVSADVEDNVTHKVSLKNILIFGDSKFSLSISVNKNTEEES